MPTAELGVYSIVISVFMVFVTVLNSGLPLAASKATIINKNNPNKLYGSISSTLIISLIICVVMGFIIWITKPLLCNYFESENAYTLLLLTVPAIVFTGVYTPFKGYLWGNEQFFKVSTVEFFEQIIRIACYFICISIFSFNDNLYPAGISLSVACVLSTIIGIIFFYTSKGKLTNPKAYFKPILKSATPITLVRLFTSLTQPFMAFILPIGLVAAGFTNEQALSQLGIAMGMTLPLISIPSTLIGSLATAIVPNLTELNNTKQTIQLKKQITSAINFTLCCSFIVLPFFISLGESTCLFLYNNITAGTYLQHTCWLIIPMGLSQITTSVLNSLNLENKTFKFYVYSCIILILSIVLLPKYIGIYSLMVGMGLSMFVVSILNIITINKTLNNNKSYVGIILKLCFICLPTTLLTSWIYNIVALILPKIIALILCGLISVISFTILMSLFNIINVTHIKTIYPKRNAKPANC